MILFFEGFEKSGKTTLAQKMHLDRYSKLYKDFNYFRSSKQINSDVNLEEAIKYDWRFMLDFLSQVEVNAIFDRSFISQYVYSMILRRENILRHFGDVNPYEKLFLEYCNKLQTIDHLVVYCQRHNYKDEKDEHVDISMVNQIKIMYECFLNHTGKSLNILRCDFEDGIEKNYRKIVRRIQ